MVAHLWTATVQELQAHVNGLSQRHRDVEWVAAVAMGTIPMPEI